MRSRTYWFTNRVKDRKIVWAGRKKKQVFVDPSGVFISFFPDYKNLHIYENQPCEVYMRHPTYKAACEHAGIRPVRIKWG